MIIRAILIQISTSALGRYIVERFSFNETKIDSKIVLVQREGQGERLETHHFDFVKEWASAEWVFGRAAGSAATGCGLAHLNQLNEPSVEPTLTWPQPSRDAGQNERERKEDCLGKCYSFKISFENDVT